ncbi:hypothetical protein MLD38_013692 [Melastoma candidum]|uniref:Uncharacterized protein n=1 Tax=Melastoma candidum TaxID=119954 RepID=A0ACB9RE28_9MYRT|nr:hypothetical protein MLD38_013692 [Melastoma candidum]
MGRDSVVQDTNQPHVVVVPYPAQGHINPLLKFAKILHGRGGFHVTFVNTRYNAHRLLKSRGPASLNDQPGFQFEAIPDGLPPVDADVMQNIPALSESLARTCLEPFVDLVSRVNRKGGPPVSCFVFDAMMPFVAAAAEKFRLPAVAFWPPAACAIWGVAQYPKLIEKGLVPLKDSSYLTNGFLDTLAIA